MKKTYQNPSIDMICMSEAQIIAASNNYGTPENGQNLGTAETTDATSGNLSRSIWGDDEMGE